MLNYRKFNVDWFYYPNCREYLQAHHDQRGTHLHDGFLNENRFVVFEHGPCRPEDTDAYVFRHEFEHLYKLEIERHAPTWRSAERFWEMFDGLWKRKETPSFEEVLHDVTVCWNTNMPMPRSKRDQGLLGVSSKIANLLDPSLPIWSPVHMNRMFHITPAQGRMDPLGAYGKLQAWWKRLERAKISTRLAAML